ncbi:unnamed protein product, partial [Closterium sp. NIES-53]
RTGMAAIGRGWQRLDGDDGEQFTAVHRWHTRATSGCDDSNDCSSSSSSNGATVSTGSGRALLGAKAWRSSNRAAWSSTLADKAWCTQSGRVAHGACTHGRQWLQQQRHEGKQAHKDSSSSSGLRATWSTGSSLGRRLGAGATEQHGAARSSMEQHGAARSTGPWCRRQSGRVAKWQTEERDGEQWQHVDASSEGVAQIWESSARSVPSSSWQIVRDAGVGEQQTEHGSKPWSALWIGDGDNICSLCKTRVTMQQQQLQDGGKHTSSGGGKHTSSGGGTSSCSYSKLLSLPTASCFLFQHKSGSNSGGSNSSAAYIFMGEVEGYRCRMLVARAQNIRVKCPDYPGGGLLFLSYPF